MRSSDPAVHADQAQPRGWAGASPSWRRSLRPRRARATREDRDAARELGADDASFAAEAEALTVRIDELENRLRELLLPKDPNDGKDVILEIKAGEGGDESALFAADLFRMYMRYAERQGWTTEVLDDEPTDLGGKEVGHVAVRARRPRTVLGHA